jgi:F0F1-type ATP synthase membrane subunit b/b'
MPYVYWLLFYVMYLEESMPQLDSTTYLTQITWLAITYATFYLTLTKTTLPIITKILYTRQYKALQAQHTHESPLHIEQQQTQQQTLQHILHACTQAKQALQHAMTQSHTWVHHTTQHLQHTQLHTLQHTYTQHMQQASNTLAHTNSALKYTMNPAAQHACHINKPNNTNKTRVFQKAALHTLFQHLRTRA